MAWRGELMIVISEGTDDTATIQVPPKPEAHKLLGAFEAAMRVGDGQYALPADQVDTFARHARRQGWPIADRRGIDGGETSTPPTWRREPMGVLKCRSCNYTQHDDACDDDCGQCRACHGCGSPELAPHILTPDEQIEINQRGMAKVQVAVAKAKEAKQPEEAP